MAKSTPKLKASKPENFLLKPLTADFKPLFKALAKGVSHGVVGKWEEIGNDAVDALSALGLTTAPGELAFLLVQRSLTRAMVELVGESASQLSSETTASADALVEKLSLSSAEIYVDRRFFDRPSELPIMAELQGILQRWLEARGLDAPLATAVVGRLPSYFVYALNQEWRRNAKSYRPLIEAIDSPFVKAGDREWAWSAYEALLDRRTQEGVFDEPFSLKQIFVPLNAYYFEDLKGDRVGDPGQGRKERPRIVTSLKNELDDWLKTSDRQDTIRVISGGPGSGKSSFARIFASEVAHAGKLRVLFVPLHLIDPSKDLVDEIGRFVKDEGVLLANPMDPESPEPNLLLIFDGLDELSSQGKAAAETARAFVREVEKTVERRNQQGVKLRVVLSGREVVVQENQAEFRRPRQILFLLPYFMPEPGREEAYLDDRNLLKADLRQGWWKNYGELTGLLFRGLPKELSREDLDEISAQPLLNYLLALSFTRKQLDFTRDVNLNSIYADLVTAVFERGYEKRRTYGPIRHMRRDDFSRVLEEIGLAAWHGDGRTTTVREIEEHCRASGLGTLLDVFRDGAKAGVTRLLAAFFFRQHGERASGDPTFVFTHKSFGEYLAGKRIGRAVERMIRELGKREQSPDEGWDDREALRHWAQICGPSAMTSYLARFLRNEISLRSLTEIQAWQEGLSSSFNAMLRQGMPMEQLNLKSFKDELYQSRNAEEALLVALNACAVLTKTLAPIKDPSGVAFGAWFKRIQGQRMGGESALAAACLSYLDLSESRIDIGDFYGANFECSHLKMAFYACFIHANMRNTRFGDEFVQHLKVEWNPVTERGMPPEISASRQWSIDMIEGADFTNSNVEHLAFAGRRKIRGTVKRGAGVARP